MMEGWRTLLMVSNKEILFTKPSNKAEFRKDSPYWKDQVQEERRFKLNYGLDIPYQFYAPLSSLQKMWERLSLASKT